MSLSQTLPGDDGAASLLLLVLVPSLRYADPRTLCQAEAVSKQLRAEVTKLDSTLWRPYVLAHTVEGTIESLNPTPIRWKQLYRSLKLWSGLRSAKFSFETQDAKEVAADVDLVQSKVRACIPSMVSPTFLLMRRSFPSIQVIGHLSSIVTESLVVGAHLVHHATQCGDLRNICTTAPLGVQRQSHPIPHSQPFPPNRALFYAGDSNRTVSQWDLERRAELSGGGIAALASTSDMLASGARLAVLKMLSLNFAEIHVWQLGSKLPASPATTAASAEGLAGAGEADRLSPLMQLPLASPPLLVASARLQKPLMYLPAFGVRGAMVVSVRKDEDAQSRQRAVERVTSAVSAPASSAASGAASGSGSAGAADLDPMAVLALMRAMQGQAAGVRQTVTSQLEAAVRGSSTPTAASTSTEPAADPSLPVVAVEVRSTLSPELPVVCTAHLTVPNPTARVVAALTSFHLVTLVRGETVLEFRRLKDGKLVGRLDVKAALSSTPQNGKTETVSRISVIEGEGDCPEEGLLLGTSFAAIVWVDIARRRCIRYGRGDKGDRGGMWLLVWDEVWSGKEERARVLFKRLPHTKKK
ncbi:hypothetical protein DFJ73DRAFT_569868 [Zopfochytrium polystomum]|nr:hypothetical protein DFJ73DRAFT_569868 [Zopfochytrium polystomum]